MPSPKLSPNTPTLMGSPLPIVFRRRGETGWPQSPGAAPVQGFAWLATGGRPAMGGWVAAMGALGEVVAPHHPAAGEGQADGHADGDADEQHRRAIEREAGPRGRRRAVRGVVRYRLGL